VTDASEGKYKLLEVELWHYFGETCPVLVARWEAAIRGLAPPFLRELQGRLQELGERVARYPSRLFAIHYEHASTRAIVLPPPLGVVVNERPR